MDLPEHNPPSSSPGQRAAVLALVGASLLWGLAWLPLKALSALGMAGLPLNVVAFGASSLVLLPLLLRSHPEWRGQARWLLLIGLLGGYANMTFTLALMHGEVVRVMVLFYLLPAWGALGGRLFLGEAVDGPRLVAVALALLGAFLVLGGPDALGGRLSWVDLLAVTCGISFAANNLVFRARQSIPVPTKVAAMLAGCFVLAVGMTALTVPDLPPPGAAAGWWAAAYGVGWVLVATAGTQWGVTRMAAARSAVIIILELLAAIISAVLIGGETMSAGQIVGATLILIAAYLEARRS
jgi:drug/metabolite transporter (DMT)-like permease